MSTCPCCRRFVEEGQENTGSPVWEKSLGIGRASWHDFSRRAERERLVPQSGIWALALSFWTASAHSTAMRILYEAPGAETGETRVPDLT